MKKTSFILTIISCTLDFVSAQDSTSVSENPIRVSANICLLNWSNNNISNYYGSMTSFYGAVEKNLSDDFSCELSFLYGKDHNDNYLINHSQVGLSVKYAWYFLGGNRPNVFGKFGGKYLTLKASGDGENETGNSIGFSLGVGVEIPFSQKTFLTGGWDSIYSNMEFDDENVNVGSQIFYVGLIFNL